MERDTEQLYEQALVLRCQVGDEGAFELLVGRYEAKLRYYLRRMLANDDRAEDVLQDVWLDVLRRVARLRDAGAFRVWLYRIARDKAYYELRKRRKWIEFREQQDAGQTPSEEPGFSAADAARIHAALDRLEAPHREVLVLRFLNSMSYEAIAQVVGCPVGTVRSRLHYAKQALRKEMGG
jgi:RNA polymerase sigma-70 factor (ECF subfamily)